MTVFPIGAGACDCRATGRVLQIEFKIDQVTGGCLDVINGGSVAPALSND